MWMSLVLPMLFPFILQTNVQPASKSYSQLLFSGSISLENRHENKYVNDVFKDNILLSLAYMRGMIDDKYKISWDNVRQEFKYSLTLSPNTTFAFHEDVLSKYKNTLSATTKAHFNYQEGFKSDGYIVCQETFMQILCKIYMLQMIERIQLCLSLITMERGSNYLYTKSLHKKKKRNLFSGFIFRQLSWSKFAFFV